MQFLSCGKRFTLRLYGMTGFNFSNVGVRYNRDISISAFLCALCTPYFLRSP